MLLNNVESVVSTIKVTAARVGRNLDEILLVAVSKRKTTAEIEPVLRALSATGINFVLGENYVQEWKQKFPILGNYKAHMIGALQRNKAAQAIELFDCIESVDSERLALELNSQAAKAGKKVDFFLQVNISNDQNKHGIDYKDLNDMLAKLLKLDHLSLRGLMTITQSYQRAEDARPDFRRLRELADGLSQLKVLQEYLKQRGLKARLETSMGMSQDFEIAIEEGADVVRVGSALFGERQV